MSNGCIPAKVPVLMSSLNAEAESGLRCIAKTDTRNSI